MLHGQGIGTEAGMLDRANGGAEPPAEILRAIRHGVAAGACRVAAALTGDDHWAGEAERQSRTVTERLHQAASRHSSACAAASTSVVTPSARSVE